MPASLPKSAVWSTSCDIELFDYRDAFMSLHLQYLDAINVRLDQISPLIMTQCGFRLRGQSIGELINNAYKRVQMDLSIYTCITYPRHKSGFHIDNRVYLLVSLLMLLKNTQNPPSHCF